ncbi:sigma-70 family RNA polymerase sigma factor [Allopusillimonas ginsengisoli]|uniref:sigma-70 family RNA polymerase sigma factor n=1 Tax=Allopusillimonas ginsengisoli TaxID=453575 RepID=UPI00101F2229|nr:sigma-70 family RNA polymerase sigma factor [Allopusillimonas ginsengisoli]TEA70374.1 sigma-70 family RNA polymerase sigma factor [Allopusillimonas ginsengisoli]
MAVAPVDYDAALRACARGDENAFQQLYEHEAPHMLALGLSMLGQRASAEELLRDTFTLIWKNAESFDEDSGTGRAWMYSILRYRALKRLRQAARNPLLDAQAADNLPDATDVRNAATSSLLRALSQLDESQRAPIMMAFYKGYTYEQIAARLKVPAAQLKTRVQVGLSLLKELRQA